MIQSHVLAGSGNIIRAGIEGDPGCNVPAVTWVTNEPKCGEVMQSKTHLGE